MRALRLSFIPLILSLSLLTGCDRHHVWHFEMTESMFWWTSFCWLLVVIGLIAIIGGICGSISDSSGAPLLFSLVGFFVLAGGCNLTPRVEPMGKFVKEQFPEEDFSKVAASTREIRDALAYLKRAVQDLESARHREAYCRERATKSDTRWQQLAAHHHRVGDEIERDLEQLKEVLAIELMYAKYPRRDKHDSSQLKDATRTAMGKLDQITAEDEESHLDMALSGGSQH